ADETPKGVIEKMKAWMNVHHLRKKKHPMEEFMPEKNPWGVAIDGGQGVEPPMSATGPARMTPAAANPMKQLAATQSVTLTEPVATKASSRRVPQETPATTEPPKRSPLMAGVRGSGARAILGNQW